MTYLFTNNQEIKNEVDGPISIAVYDSTGNNAHLNSNTYPLYVNLANNIIKISSDTSNPVVVSGDVTGNVKVSGDVTGNVLLKNNNVVVSGNVSLVDSNGNFNSNTYPLYVNSQITNLDNNPILVKYSDRTNTQLDTQERLRVTIPSQQWWYVPSIDKDTDLRFSESVVGTGANSYFIQNLASIYFTSGLTYSSNTALTGQVIRGSRRRHKIRPSVSHQFFTIHNWDGKEPNVTKRRGMFTAYNGIFFEVSDKLYAVVRRRLLDGTLVEKRIPCDQFSEDKLDGSGISGLDFRDTANTKLALTGYVANTTIKKTVSGSSEDVYNVTYTTSGNTSFISVGSKVTVTGVTPATYNGVAMIQSTTSNTITLSYTRNPGNYSSMSSGLLTHTNYHDMFNWWFDFNGGRTSKIRFGVNGATGPVVLHIEDFLGIISTQYENAPALMDRTEIINTGVPDYMPSFTTAGSSFNIEAEVELSPGFGVAKSSNTVILTKSSGQEYAVLAVGLRAGEPYQRGDVQIQSIEIIDIGNTNQNNYGVYEWRLVLNPTFDGTAVPAPTNIGKATRQWSFNTGTTITGGTTLTGGYLTSMQQEDVTNSLNFLNMGSNLTYDDADKVVLMVKIIANGTADGAILSTIRFIEAL
jgi:hypothetical protein